MLRSIAGYQLDEAPLRRLSGFCLFGATRLSDNKRVFVETSEHGASVSVAARLRREFAFLQELGLSGIIRPLELVERGAATVLVLEDPGYLFLDGLGAKGETGPLPFAEATKIASNAARILDELHRRGFVHGGLSTKNMLVDPHSFAVTLLGLGSGLRGGEQGAALRETSREVDLVYAAPERTGRTGQGFDGRADLYSLGAIFYEMLTGKPPFVFDDPLELSHAHLARTPLPARENHPLVPIVLSDIVDKLLNKSPTDRYRRGLGLVHDLERFLREGPGAAPFSLGRSDAPDARRIRDKPIGRDAESASLARVAVRVRNGAVALVLVVGPTGSGKSMFVEGAREPMTQQGGLFASGKFEVGAAPYAAFAEVLGKLGRRVLTEPEDRLLRVREHFAAAAEEGGRLLTDLAPALELVFGKMPPLSELPAVESRRRVERVVRAALQAFRADRPLLAIFFDDLGDADPASLSLIGHLLADKECGRLLIIGAIHEEEAAPGKPLRFWLSDLAKKKGVTISRIVLSPLAAPDVAGVLADVLGGEAKELMPLARILNEKTQGNPFSIVQMLEALLAEGLIGRNNETLALQWDERRIREAPIATDAAELAAGRMRKLSPDERRMLGAAACVGNVFDAGRVAVALGLGAERAQGAQAVQAQLAAAVPNGMIVALDAEGAGDHAFVHEKVREAALSLVPSEERQRMHLLLARSLRLEGIFSDERLFEVTRHYGEALSLITSIEERRVVANLALGAGRKARERAAFQAAAAFFATGVDLCSNEMAEASTDFIYELFAERAACEWLVGRHEIADELFSKALFYARSRTERAHVHGQRLAQRTTQGFYEEAIAAGRAGLAELGFDLPMLGGEEPATLSRLASILRLLRNRSPLSLAEADAITDPFVLGRLELLVGLVAPTYISNPALYFVVILEVVAIHVEFGHADVAPYVYAIFALIVTFLHGDRVLGRQFFEVASLLEPRTKSLAMRGKVAWAIAACGAHFWPIRRSLPMLGRSMVYAVESGDAPYLSYSLHFDVTFRYWSGEPLPAVKEAFDKAIAMMPQSPDPMGAAILRTTSRMVEALSGRTAGPTSFDGADFDDAAFVAEIEPTFHYATCLHHTLRAELCYLYGDFETALGWIKRAESRITSALYLHLETATVFVGALVRAALAREATGAERETWLAELSTLGARISAWAENCPENFLHQASLVAAETAALMGRHGEARELYDEAVEAAQKNGFLQHEALVHELAAVYYWGRGKADLSRSYFTSAARLYGLWGAVLKAEQIRLRLSEATGLFAGPISRDHLRPESGPARSLRSLDATAIVRAAEAIASEIDFDRLLTRLLAVVLSVAGADRGALVLQREGALLVAATMRVEGAELCGMRPLALQNDISSSVVQYVARTRLPVVIGRGPLGTAFEADAHLSTLAPRSFLGLPLIHRDVLTGVLYLENRLMEDAFSEGRAELLSLLSSQAAIAIENALLVADVRQRTDELAAANHELREELTRRELLEQERAELSEEVIAMQRARLAELSAPLVPITDRVVVIPIVGTMDDARAEDLMQVALTGVSELQLSVLILDMTGVTEVSLPVAERLIALVRGIELLGATVVLTGIRGEVARALVGLDIDFGTKVATRSTLAAGITHAFSKQPIVSHRR